MTISELIVKGAKAWEAAKNFLDEHPAMSGEDIETYNKMEADIESLTDSINRMQKLEDMAQPVNVPAKAPVEKTENSKDSAFWNYVRTGVKNNTYTQTEGTNADGGYAVPKGFEAKIIEIMNNANVIRPLATIITTATASTDIPVVSAHGAAGWTTEATALTNSNDTFSVCTLGAYKASRLVRVSEELLSDNGVDLESYLAKAIGESLAALEETAFVAGTGSGQPTGFLSTAVSAKTTAAAAAVTFEEMVDLFFALKQGYRNNGTWLMNSSTLAAVRKLKDTAGSYIFAPATVAGQPDLILGRPVICSENMENIAAGKKAVAFGDFSYYHIGQRGPLVFKRLNERFADTDEVGFVGIERVDGKLALGEAVKVLTQKAS